MLEELIEEMEKSIESDDFELVMEDCMQKVEMEDIGSEAITPLLKFMERHPLADFGMPGAIVHYVERFYKNGYEELLMKSIKRRPTMHTVWMLNRIINGSEEAEKYIDLMREVINRPDVHEDIKKSAENFLLEP